MRQFAAGVLLLVLPIVAQALGSVVDAKFVEKAAKRGAVVWDIRAASGYDLGHIPGAINIGFVAEALLDPKTQQYLPIETIAERLGAAGIDLKREIVVYGGAGSTYPYFTQFSLEYFGARRVHVFHQGIDGWRAAKKPVSTLPATRSPVKVRPFANPALLATTGEVVSRIGNASVQFVDVRSLAEYTGEQSETLQGGHIPGAIHIPYSHQFVDPDAMRAIMAKETSDTSGLALKSRAALKRLYAALDPRKETIVYCHSGIRASMTAAVLTRLGFHSVRVYHASWLEYGNQPEALVETGLPLE
jgi:thiosulfate/3-mercaptopyruvate sulfurtransferase